MLTEEEGLSVNCCNHNCELLKHLHINITAALRITQSFNREPAVNQQTAHSVKSRRKQAELHEEQDNGSLLTLLGRKKLQ